MTTSLSASGLLRARICPSSCALPQVTETSEESRRGQSRHRYLEGITDGLGARDSLALIPEEHRRECAAIDTSGMPIDAESEVAMAYDVATGAARRLAPKRHREYDCAATEIPGTADAVRWGDVPEIYDWKGCVYGQDRDAIDEQMDHYALCATIVSGKSQAKCIVGSIADDGSISWRERVLDWEDLSAIEQRTLATHSGVVRKNAERESHELTKLSRWIPDVSSGSHCRYCPSLVYCPAKQAAVQSLIAIADGDAITKKSAADAWMIAKDAERSIASVKPLIQQLTREHNQLESSDGRVVRFNSAGSLTISKKASRP